jgi:eukaryotic-like serine/threonine-protein kinase
MATITGFLKSKTFLINLAAAVLLVILVGFSISSWLSGFTHHGESISVPDVRGLKLNRLETFLEAKNLQYKIVDSLFDVEKAPGMILEQDPAPDSKVKENRTLYLTINASHPPDVKMPNLIDVSYRQAEAILSSYGLKVGQLIYKPDLAKNAVLDQLYKGSHINPMATLSKGSTIDLVLGDGLGSVDVPVPDLNGLTRGEALFVLKGSSLNIGRVYFDSGVRDSTNARVYRQEPDPSNEEVLKQGEAVNIYLH